MNYTTTIITLLSCSLTSYTIIKWSSVLNLSKTNTSGERFASQSKPIFGGFIFLIGIIATIIADYFISSTKLEYFVFLIPIIVSFSAGLLDDIKNTPPGFKFVTQIITGLIIYYTNLCPSYFSNELLNLSLCVFWTVTLMNSLNMLDNMDAITSSVSLSIIISILIANLFFALNFSSVPIAIAIAIAIFVFLFFNWHPSSMYMGDNGSQLIGATIAILTLEAFSPTTISSTINFRPLFAIIIALSVPLSDTFAVSLNRIKEGKSPFIGDRNHTTHNLYYLGFSIPAVAITFIILTLITNTIAYAILLNLFDSIIIESVLILIVLSISVGLYYTTIVKKKSEC